MQTDRADVAQALGLATAKAAAIAVLKNEDEKFVAYGTPITGALTLTDTVIVTRILTVIVTLTATVTVTFTVHCHGH